MKRRISGLGLVVVLALSLVGCGTSSITTPPPTGITVNDIKYEVVNTVPEGIDTLVNRGYIVVKKESQYVVTILAGEKPSLGYGIEVQSVKDTGGKTEIIVDETEPKPGEMNGMVISYPKVTIIIGNNIAPDFVVSNSKGDRFENINPS